MHLEPLLLLDAKREQLLHALRDALRADDRLEPGGLVVRELAGALTDEPVGRALSELPYAQMIKDHARWCETGGGEGKPSSFDGADLRSLAAIRGYNLTALSAKGAVFYGLDMEGVQLQGAHLENADLRSANLKGADLRGVRLAGARMNGADLRGAQLGPLMIAADRLLPADLTGACLRGADLSGADLKRAILAGADLSRAMLFGACLRQADLTGAITTGARGLETDAVA